MDNFHHYSHQFYFERYLRNKLSQEDRVKLETQLQENESLQRAFTEYKSNRKVFLKELITEHDKGPKKSRLANLFYLTISLIGIFTAINFYLENQSLKEEREQHKNLISRLIDHIPFVGRKHEPDSTLEKYTKNVRQRSAKSPASISLESGVDTEVESEQSDVMLDTVLVPLLRDFYEEKSTYFRSEIDSSLTSTEIQQMVLKNAGKYDIKYKTNPIAVVMERNAQSVNTYTYDGLKLIISGSKLPDHLLLVSDQGELVWLNGDQEVLLIADNKPHDY